MIGLGGTRTPGLPVGMPDGTTVTFGGSLGAILGEGVLVSQLMLDPDVLDSTEEAPDDETTPDWVAVLVPFVSWRATSGVAEV